MTRQLEINVTIYRLLHSASLTVSASNGCVAIFINDPTMSMGFDRFAKVVERLMLRGINIASNVHDYSAGSTRYILVKIVRSKIIKKKDCNIVSRKK